MKNSLKTIGFSLVLGLFTLPLFAQQSAINFYRLPDQGGLNVFESTKQDTVPYTGFKLRIGGNFTQQYQNLSHSN